MLLTARTRSELPGFVIQVVILLAWPVLCSAQDGGIRLGEQTTSKWRFGVVVKATGGAVTGIRATLPVPMDWPEQTVKKINEEKTSNVDSITYRPLDAGVRQMIITIPRLPTGGEASAVVTLEVTKSRILPPDDTSVYQVPKSSAALAKFLAPSPYIESKDPKIQALAAQLTADKPQAWDKAAAIFDWVRENVKYEFADDIRPANVALNDGKGDCEELSSLVVALCRASKIPARAVWVPRHTYPEFYLVDDQGKGHWFPCQAAGAEREFGGMKEDRPILQKGDNFTVPGERAPQRYVQQSLRAKDAAADPVVKFIMEKVKE
jgi:transglutaminase-like putative cysteine protease